MRKLYLTSVRIDKLVGQLPAKPEELKLAYIPTAADPYEDKWFIEADRKNLKELGFKFTEVDLKNQTEEKLFEALKSFDIIFVSGGNTFYLLEKVRESGFDKIIGNLLDSGVIYVGASAGATLAGPDIAPVNDLDDPSKAKLENTKGLGLVDFVILPHYGKEKYLSRYQKIIDDYKDKFKLKTLTDDQAVWVEDNSVRVLEI